MVEIRTVVIKNSNFLKDLEKAQAEYRKRDGTLNNYLSHPIEGSDIYRALIGEQEKEVTRSLGTLLGLLKVSIDTAPRHLHAKSNEIMDSFFECSDANIKMLIQKNVSAKLRPGEKLGTIEQYKALSHDGTNCISIKNFESFYPGIISSFVKAFAIGYSEGFHTIIAESGDIKGFNWTKPLEKDVWKNISYFIDPTCNSYRLDGIFPFTKKKNFLNADIYKKLQQRSAERFSHLTIAIY